MRKKTLWLLYFAALVILYVTVNGTPAVFNCCKKGLGSSVSAMRQTLFCPEQPRGYRGSRQNIALGSPVLFLIPTGPDHPKLRDVWREHLIPLMPSLNFDAVFLVETKLKNQLNASELTSNKDIAFYDVPDYKEVLAGFYYRAVEGWRWGLSEEKEYEWFIRADIDAFYCLHHIRLEINALETERRAQWKPGIHWSHFYGDGAGGQPGPPVSDVFEIFNRYAAQEAVKYAVEAMHDGIWDHETVEVLGSNIADLSPNVTQVHDVRWAYGAGVDGNTYWNSGFLGYNFADECLCANWLAIHLGKHDIEAKFEKLASYAQESQDKEIQFNQAYPPDGAKIGYSPPYFSVGGCQGKKKNWRGCK